MYSNSQFQIQIGTYFEKNLKYLIEYSIKKVFEYKYKFIKKILIVDSYFKIVYKYLFYLINLNTY